MITDMSGTAYTFAFISLRPIIFFSISEDHLKQNIIVMVFTRTERTLEKIIFKENDLINTIDYLMLNRIGV